MKILSLIILVVVGSISLTTHAQTQYSNKVVVIPLLGEGSTWKGPWADGVSYRKSDIVEDGGSSYIAIANHTSDLANMPPSAQWQIVAASGANGAPGPKGDKGDQGDKGDKGDQGIQGMKGDQGDQGVQGMKGDQGDQGIQGMKGDQGDQGIQGMKGDQGDQGIQGMKGDQGDQGIQGMKGDQGDQGIQGMKGDQGDQGIQGMKGDQGDQGIQGLMGIPGMQGIQGEKGDPGEKGDKGDKGDLGSAIVYTGNAPITIVNDEPNSTGTISFNTAALNGQQVLNLLPPFDLHQPSLAINCQVSLLGVFPSRSQEKYLGEIIWTGINFPIRGFAECNGQLLPINSNQALFSLYGCTFGGDCRTTLGLPDMRGRVPVHYGNGPGLPTRELGEKFGRTSE